MATLALELVLTMTTTYNILNNQVLGDVATVLRDARFSESDFQYDTAEHRFHLSLWVAGGRSVPRVSLSDKSSKDWKKGWSRLLLRFVEVQSVEIDKQESVPFYEIANITEMDCDGAIIIEISTHYSLTIRLNVATISIQITSDELNPHVTKLLERIRW